MAANEKWQTQDEEIEHRRVLLARAHNGDAKAQRELMEVFGARIYSDKEKARMVYETEKAAQKPRGRSKAKKGEPKA